jgi:uncharacterized protein (TIGR02246 family)
MTSDVAQIRALIEGWARAVHTGDMDGVLADHAGDIVMFDVPPPYEGIRGLDAYRKTWPPFFAWQADGAVFEIESLDVTAGADVAFAHALLRCDTPEGLAVNPRNRLRLTLGLRKQDGRWLVAHEHHSFPLTSDQDQDAEHELRRLHERWFQQTAAKDLDGMMTAMADDIVSCEEDGPLEYRGIKDVRAYCERGLTGAGDAAITWTIPDLRIQVRGGLAVAHGLDHVRVDPPGGQAVDSWCRATRVFERRNGTWLMTYQHRSLPYDPSTGQAALGLQP